MDPPLRVILVKDNSQSQSLNVWTFSIKTLHLLSGVDAGSTILEIPNYQSIFDINSYEVDC